MSTKTTTATPFHTRTMIFKLFKRGLPYTEIARELNAEGFRTIRGTKFTATRVQTFCNYHKLYRRGPGPESLQMFGLIQQPARR